MTTYTGRMGKGFSRTLREIKRNEAEARNATSTYNADIRRVAAEQNVSPRTARHVVNAERTISRAKAQLLAGEEAYREGRPLPANASRPFRRGYERAARVDARFPLGA